MSEDLPYWIAFSVFPGIGPVRFGLLRSYFRSAKAAYTASEKELRAVGLPEKILLDFLDFRKKFTIDSYLQALKAQQIRVVCADDTEYPKLLKETSDRPYLLYCFGNGPLSLLSKDRMIGVVGTRNMTPYGALVTRRLTEELLTAGCCIVSGMALGVDGQAHRTAIEFGGDTVAVLGCGVDLIAPSSHRDLYYAIAKKGLIISEMPLGHRPTKGLFPARNRIISGLSRGVVITEGAIDSGSLITARYAAEQGRDVFAVPGAITNPYSAGPMALIKKGAKPVTTVEDILEEYGWNGKRKQTVIRLSDFTSDEQLVLRSLSTNETPFDALVVETGLTAAKLASAISHLEIIGCIAEFGDHTYRIEGSIVEPGSSSP